MTETFYEQPILNSPYAEPTRHHALDEDGQPLIIPGRRPATLRANFSCSQIEKATSQDRKESKNTGLNVDDGISTEEQEYGRPIINEIRSRVADWRRLPSQPTGA